MPKRALNQLVGGCNGWSIDPQYLKESHEKLQNRQREWMKRPERRERKGKKKKWNGKGRERGRCRKGGASQSEETRTCNKLHPPFHPSLHLHPSINQPTVKACCLFLCREGTAGLAYSSLHSPIHPPTHSLTYSLTHSTRACSRIGWFGG